MDEKNNAPNEVIIIETEDAKITANYIRSTGNGVFEMGLHCKGVIPYGYWIRSAAINGVMCEPYENFLHPTEEGDMNLELRVVYGVGSSTVRPDGTYTMPTFEDVTEIKLDVVVLEDDGTYGDVEEPDDVYANQHGIAGKYISTIFPHGRPENYEYTIGGIRGIAFDTDECVIFIKDTTEGERVIFPNDPERRKKMRNRRIYIAAINKTDKEMYVVTHSCQIDGKEAEVSHVSSRILPGLSIIDAVQYIRPEEEYDPDIKNMKFAIAVQIAEPKGPRLLMNNMIEIKLKNDGSEGEEAPAQAPETDASPAEAPKEDTEN